MKLLLLTLPLIFVSWVSAETQLRYQVTFDADDPQYVKVQAEMMLVDRSVSMATWGHSQEVPRGWAHFIEGLEILQNGKPLSVKAGDDATWNVKGKDGQPISVNYRVRMDHAKHNWDSGGGNDARPEFVADAHFIVTKALFIVSGNGPEKSEVTLHLPQDWQVSTPWRPLDAAKHHYAASNLYRLVNNVLVVGPHAQQRFEKGGMDVIVAIDSRMESHFDLFRETFDAQLAAYEKVFGELPEGRYVVALRKDVRTDGEAFETSFNQTFGNDNLEERKVFWACLVGHELFHYWNGSRINPEKHQEVEWFKEGFTEYYASLTAARTGIINEAEWFDKLEVYFSRYMIMRRWGPGRPSLMDAGQDKMANWPLIYGGGATLALVLDMDIRTATDGEKSLDTVMRLLEERYGRTGKTYSLTDLENLIGEVKGESVAAFFEEHVRGKGFLPDIATALRPYGMVLRNNHDEYYLSKDLSVEEGAEQRYRAFMWQN